MKKFLLSVLCLVFFVVNTGFVVNLHFCMNKLHSWEIGSQTSEKCDTCGMPTAGKNGCCHDEVKVVKLQQDVVQAHSSTTLPSLPFIVAFTSTYLHMPVMETENRPVLQAHSPPLINAPKIYIEHCVFRI